MSKEGVTQRINGRIFQWPLLTFLFSLPILQPIARRQLTCGFDNVFHLWRSVQVGALIREGVWFSRWAPHMAHGYGYPLFQFQSPLSAYLVALINVLGVDWPLALNIGYGLGLVGSGVATWWLAREFWGDHGGLLSGVALMVAPYHLYVLFYRASLSETVAWLFPPLVLWGVWRWQFGQRRGLWTAVLAQALLFYTHDVTAYIFLPLFLAWPLGLGWAMGSGGRGAVWRGVTAVLLGFFAGAFFWLPAIVERRFIQFDRAGSAWPFLPQNNFLPLDQLFALPRNANPLLLNDWPARGLGAVLLLLAIVGFVMAWRRGGVQRRVTVVFAILFLGYLFLVTPLSSFLWDNIDVLAAFQFPWRFLSPVVLMASLLAGGVFNCRLSIVNCQLSTGRGGQLAVSSEQSTVNSQQSTVNAKIIHNSERPSVVFVIHNSQFITLPAITLLLVLLHFGWVRPALCEAPADLSVSGMVDWEMATGTLGTTASRELLPTTVERLPQDEVTPLENGRFSLPPSVQIGQTDESLLDGFIEVESAEPFTAVYQAFTFPGWQATLNGHPVEIVPSEPEGLITMAVPDGRSQLRVFRRNTAVQSVGIGVALLALLGTFVSGVRYQMSGVGDRGSESKRSRSLITFYFLLFTTLLIFALKQTPLLNHSRPIPQGVVGDIAFGTVAKPGLVTLVGVEPFDTAVPADQPFELTLYWQANQPLVQNYRVGLTLYDEAGVRWSEVGLRDYRWSRAAPPTTQWPLDQIVETSFFVDTLPGTPPGRYRMELTFFDEMTLEPLSTVQGPALDLGEVTVSPPKRPLTPAEFGEESDFIVLNGRSIRPLFDRKAAAPGDVVLVTLLAKLDGNEGEATLQLIDEEGTAVVTETFSLTHAEGVWRHQKLLRLPATLGDGSHKWQLEIGEETAVVDTLQIDAPERLFEQPAVDIMSDIVLGDQVRLLGATLSSDTLSADEPLTVSLVWQGVVEMTESYPVFVQLLDPNGQLVAQSDQIPAGWTRPTTGWQPGEFVIDVHTLQLPDDLPADDYRLIVGMVGVNGRLLTPDGADFVTLTTLSSE